MFLKYLKIENNEGIIRRIEFHQGLNLIVDETKDSTSDTGNNVGKTTLLFLINYCLGGEAYKVYKSSDKSVNKEVKRFLEETEVIVELVMAESLTAINCRQVRVRRNFLKNRKAIREINGEQVLEKNFDSCLQQAIWDVKTHKPTFRQIISHSLRIDALRLEQVMQTFPTSYGKYLDYEALHLYMFGANIDDADRKAEISRQVNDDMGKKRWLEKKGELGELNSRLSLLIQDISSLEERKNSLWVNPDFENDLIELSFVENELRHMGNDKTNLSIRKQLIMEAVGDMQVLDVNINTAEVEEMYKEASSFNIQLHHSFKELLKFHNAMLERRVEFIIAEIPQLDRQLEQLDAGIKEMMEKSLMLQEKLNRSATRGQIDEYIARITTLYQEKGELEKSIADVTAIDGEIRKSRSLLENIEKGQFTPEWERRVQEQIDKFNVHFTEVSRILYGEEYIVTYYVNEKNSKTPTKCYVFQSKAMNSYGSGKKQGEIICFDLAYVKFADDENIPCLHFTLYDKLELVHNNQLERIVEVIERMGNEQCVAAILRDKLPKRMDSDKYVIAKLSESERLFKMEESAWYKATHQR